MALTFDPSTAYGHVHRFLPGSKPATLTHQTAEGVAETPYNNGFVRHRTFSKSDLERFAGAFEAQVTRVGWDWFQGDSDSHEASVNDLLEVDGVLYVVGAVDTGRWGSQQMLVTARAAENG